MPAETKFIAENIARVRERIARAAERAGRRAEEITLVAVSKTFPAEAIRAAYEAGVRHFGENRLQEFEAKRGVLADLQGVTWHMIGHVQGNKARKVAELFGRVDSINRFSLAETLDAAIAEGARGERLPVLIEVKLGGEETKTGAEEASLAQLADDVMQKCPDLELRGVMAIPPYAEDPERARPYFRRLRELRDELQRKIARELPALSTGMSHDFEVAIEEGATEVRIGTAIFGERRKPR
ncbi:MAG TPA: YggS family pyridoxal phosphate-dependent enzyme [Candidatus Dormibacteraeota bacterium]|nr:YggS family pyridoxal phosphate-dependent enzyme [Candidatus Dormibacteraeota bacterium]